MDSEGYSSNISDALLFPRHEICRTMEDVDKSVTQSSASFLDSVKPDYTYDMLNSEDMNRLLVFKPGYKDSKIRCDLITSRISEAPDYEALSYVWGSSVKPGIVWCNGKILKVTSNLYAALRTVRHRLRQRVMWADAICINQSDLHERKLQVRIMRRIYERALCVLIWLGPEDRRDNAAIERIENLGSICVKAGYSDPNDLIRHKDLHKFTEPLFEHFFSKGGEPWDWPSLSRFFELPYFCRTCIIQEIQANSKYLAFCGDKKVDFNYVQFAALFLIHFPPSYNRGKYTDRGLRMLFTLGHWLLAKLHYYHVLNKLGASLHQTHAIRSLHSSSPTIASQ
jgi:heterokaryon incompatibility protein (HET)